MVLGLYINNVKGVFGAPPQYQKFWDVDAYCWQE